MVSGDEVPEPDDEDAVARAVVAVARAVVAVARAADAVARDAVAPGDEPLLVDADESFVCVAITIATATNRVTVSATTHLRIARIRRRRAASTAEGLYGVIDYLGRDRDICDVQSIDAIRAAPVRLP